jgi:hypothetical protein
MAGQPWRAFPAPVGVWGAVSAAASLLLSSISPRLSDQDALTQPWPRAHPRGSELEARLALVDAGAEIRVSRILKNVHASAYCASCSAAAR